MGGEEAVGLFGNLTKKEMMGVASEPAGSIRKASKETARRTSDGQKSPSKSAAVSLSATGNTDAFGMSNAKSPKSGVVQAPPPPRLTAENLQKIGKTEPPWRLRGHRLQDCAESTAARGRCRAGGSATGHSRLLAGRRQAKSAALSRGQECSPGCHPKACGCHAKGG